MGHYLFLAVSVVPGAMIAFLVWLVWPDAVEEVKRRWRGEK